MPHDERDEIHALPQLQFRMDGTSEARAALAGWSASVPTIYFLDICVVGATKMADGALAAEARKAELVARLRNLDRPHNAFSYLMALMEKVSDTRIGLSDQELEGQILTDVGSMRRFFVNARVLEGDEFLRDFARQLRREPLELMRPAYLEFLRAANDRFQLANPVSRAKRLRMAEQVMAQADALSIGRQHAIVLLTLACLYGNASARRVMKYKADPQTFEAENALADVMTISRFLNRKLEIEDDGRRGLTPYRRAIFITDDSGLDDVLACFEGEAVSSKEKDGHHEERTNVRVEFAKLLTEIGEDAGKPRNSGDLRASTPSEYDRVCAMLFAMPIDAP